MDKIKWLKKSFFDGEEEFMDDGEWASSGQVDEFDNLVGKLFDAVTNYDFPDGTEAGDDIALWIGKMQAWINDGTYNWKDYE